MAVSFHFEGEGVVGLEKDREGWLPMRNSVMAELVFQKYSDFSVEG